MADPYRDAYDRMNRQAATRPKKPKAPAGLSKSDLAAIAAAGGGSGPPSQPAALDALLERAPAWSPYLGAVKNTARVRKVDAAQLLAALIFRDPQPAGDPAGLIDGTARQMGQTIRSYAGDLDAWFGGTYGRRADGAGPASLFVRANIADYQPSLPVSDVQAVEAEAARRQARATLHTSDPWVTVKRDRAGRAIGFDEAIGPNAPDDVLLYGGQPVTQSVLRDVWTAGYADVYEEFTGSVASPADIEGILARGVSHYALRSELASRPGFRQSPAWKANAPGLIAAARTMLGTDPPELLIRQAFAEGWDAATFEEKVRDLPAYTKGPEFTSRVAANRDTYTAIFGTPNKEGETWLKEATVNGWTPDAVAGKLRSADSYKYSPEAQQVTIALLDSLGMFVGARPIVRPVKDPPPPKGASADEPAPAAPAVATLPTPPKKPATVKP